MVVRNIWMWYYKGGDEMEPELGHSDFSLLLVIVVIIITFLCWVVDDGLKSWNELSDQMIKWWNNTKKGIYRTENSHFGIKIPSIKKGDGINVLKLSILSSLCICP